MPKPLSFLHCRSLSPWNRKQARRTERYEPGSLFLRLPPEIRLLVYEHAFSSSSETITVTITRDRKREYPSRLDNFLHLSKDKSTQVSYKCKPPISFPSQLLRANKQIYHEALPVMYQTVTFFPDSTDSSFGVFLGLLSDFARHQIGRIRLCLDKFLESEWTHCTADLAWKVTCAQVISLPSLREVALVASDGLTVSGSRRLHGYLKPFRHPKVRETVYIECVGLGYRDFTDIFPSSQPSACD